MIVNVARMSARATGSVSRVNGLHLNEDVLAVCKFLAPPNR
jgi:hypothetical protein